jgi:hypothetical protein
MSKSLITTLLATGLFPLANEEPQLQILDARGNALTGFVRDGNTITLGNASTALAAAPLQRLSTFAVGYPSDNADAVAQFIAPYVPAPIKFDYQVNPLANAFVGVEDDGIGANGLPMVIRGDAKSTVSATLQWRGLETPFTEFERQIAGSIPGGSVQMEEDERMQLLVESTRRGRLLRIIAAAAASTGGATAKTWNSSADPIYDLRAEIKTIANVAGGRQNVRILFGSDAFEVISNHATLKGGVQYAQQVVDEAYIARLLGLPVGNVMISYVQVVSSKQGKTTTKADLLTGGDLYLFGCVPTPNRQDGSFMKTFAMQMAGGYYGAYSWQPHPNVTNLGLSYYERIAVTNATASKRLAVTAS